MKPKRDQATLEASMVKEIVQQSLQRLVDGKGVPFVISRSEEIVGKKMSTQKRSYPVCYALISPDSTFYEVRGKDRAKLSHGQRV